MRGNICKKSARSKKFQPTQKNAHVISLASEAVPQVEGDTIEASISAEFPVKP